MIDRNIDMSLVQGVKGKVMKNCIRILRCGVAALAVQVSGTAIAQDGATADNQFGGDIVVTAEKRESTLQRTPIAMSVFTPDTLSSNGVNSIADLSRIAPSVNLAQNSVNTIITIRGVSSRDTTEIGDPAVSISSDGFYFQHPFGLNESIYDLERVEVLRGPQGTLYGRNATGGAVNFITAKPGKDFDASLSAGYGNYNAYTADGFINVPLGETLSARGSFFFRKHDGYRTNNYAGGKDGDDANAKSARLQLKFDPTDRLSILLKGEYTDVGGVGPTFYGVPLTGAVDYDMEAPKVRQGSALGQPRQSIDMKSKLVELTANYDFGFAGLTYIGGWRSQKYSQVRDLDGLLKSDAYFIPSEDAEDWQHELRLTSSGNGPFQWQLGAFYFRNKNNLATYFSTYADPAYPDGYARFSFIYPKVVAKSKAVFGQASYEIVPNLKAEAGVRYSKDEKFREGYSDTSGAAELELPANQRTTVGSASSDKWTYHLAMNWQATPSNLLYVKRDTGYKAGGFSDLGTLGVLQYGPENITAYEIGSKNRFGRGVFELNLSAYYYDYKDQQISQFRDGFTAVFNAGKSEVYGFEIESVVRPSPRDQLDVYLGYTHARFKDFIVGTQQYAGNRPPNSPTYQVSVGYQHDFPIGDGKLTLRGQSRLEDDYYLAFTNYGFEKQDSFTKTDFMLTYTAPQDRWSAQAYVRNIENETILTSASVSGLFGAYTFQYGDPRTYGARLTFNF